MQEFVRSVSLALNSLPRLHKMLLGMLTVLTLTVAAWNPVLHHSAPLTREVPLDDIETQRALQPEASEPLDQVMPNDAPELEPEKDDLDQKMEEAVHEHTVESGETLGSILTQYGIDMSDIHALTKSNPEVQKLGIGQELSWKLSDDGGLQQLSWVVNNRDTRVYDRNANGTYKRTVQTMQGAWQNDRVAGTVNGSFVASAKAAGLSTREIQQVTKALQWQVDFRKLKKGDKFSVLMSREFLDGKVTGSGEVKAVRLNTAGKDYYAIQAEDGRFYNREGSGLAKGFLRLPTLKQFRISSNFNPRRLHPVTKRIAPHNGVDFAAPIGTPVLSIGDGEVVKAGYHPYAGNYVVIRLGRQYQTRFLHLSKLLVKQGQKVKKGDRVALSGNTGRSTGPHLHYEFLLNGRAVDPLKVKLPMSDGLAGKDRRSFLARTKEFLPQLTLD
ncbi:MAG: murein DD-endopeptidase MepM [Plesiomonas sp.]|uniref:murein DD-endopeptidase MepM n=1 Tax=Plesiomonas sp. TaxID=2486279 RepID=UPI003F30355D